VGHASRRTHRPDACQMDTGFPVADERRRKKKQARARPPIRPRSPILARNDLHCVASGCWGAAALVSAQQPVRAPARGSGWIPEKDPSPAPQKWVPSARPRPRQNRPRRASHLMVTSSNSQQGGACAGRAFYDAALVSWDGHRLLIGGQSIAVESGPCPVGGLRYYFICNCGRRALMLYPGCAGITGGTGATPFPRTDLAVRLDYCAATDASAGAFALRITWRTSNPSNCGCPR
jgi:hypothetical protein